MNSNPPLDSQEAIKSESASTVSVRDLANVLRDLAKLYSQPRTGNPKVNKALKHLGNVLLRYADRELSEVLDRLTLATVSQAKLVKAKTSRLGDVDLRSLNLKGVRELINNTSLTKADLTEVAIQRFGIARSSLFRKSKGEVVRALIAALENAEAFDIISEEARRAGSNRTR